MDAAIPKNVRGIYVAEFLPREGNAIIHTYPENLPVDGFEWKVLPSGGHEVRSDLVHFEGEEIEKDTQNHRVCSSSNPGSELFEFLPHVKHLERMADDIVDEAPLDSVNEYVDRYRFQEPHELRVPSAALRSLERLPYDPVTYLCAMSRFLGPLLVSLIKLLQLPHKRVLLYSPAPVERAAIVGFNLAEIVHAAYVHAGRAPGDVRVRGYLGLFDLPNLKREADQGTLDHAWIAWTADKVYKEHKDVYDVFIDVSAFPYPDAARHSPSAKPIGHLISHAERPPKTRDLRWSARDLTLYLELAEQERQYEEILAQNHRPEFDEWRSKTEDGPSSGLRVTPPQVWRYKQQDGRSLPFGYSIVLAASLRVWLAEWWLIRSQLHVAVPISLVFPLGVRADGGMSTGIVDLSDSNMSIHDDEDDEDDRETRSTVSALPQETSDVRSLAESLKDSARSIVLRDNDSDSQKRTFIPAHPRFDPSIASQLPMETMSSVYLFTLWSSYVRAMYIQASAYLVERVQALPHRELREDSPLIPHLTVNMSPRDFQALTSPPPYKPQDEADVNLSEYETDSEDDEADAPQPPPSRPAPAPAPEPAPSKMRPITAQPERRTPARAPAAVTLQATAVAPPAESEEETETETETESEETESEPEPVMLKPVFVSKRDRTAAVDKPRNTTQQPDAEQKARKKAAHDLAAERVQRELREKKHEEATHDVDDTDDVDPDAEFAAWRLRELARIQRVQTQERQRREEREEVERRRALPEKQRLEEDLAYARRTRQEKQRGSQGFLQKYHHKGAFYQDMDILQRDYSQKTESAVNKAALPKIMQVRDFGKRSRSKWTHLANEDTTRHERDLRSQGL
ncbi:hypothetical protein MOBT1_001639 [Malassezia obtusa]|uniref:Micro-fibrillar-associated protein 1 C-terminal domain-containing protein n=1 Tax=Malassezia obtusa TaxID=76774 RepID=A0AAF0E0V5_9BASI|nr:hypothetical protein MOBT1_001639 [Malassezia obtusa]